MDRFEETKLRVKEATDLVALIESYLPLRPRGRLLVALCPFHAENSASFTVYREEQFYRCYGCGKTGDVFSWLMDRDGLTFREAMELLADRAGISVEGAFKQRRDAAPAGPDPFTVLRDVADFFQRCLLAEDGRWAAEYLERRGLTAAIQPWRLGYHPAAGALTRFAASTSLPRELLEDAGLLRNGREPYAGRVMFPIDDERGRTVGFGGRIVPGAPGSDGDGDYKPPKYLNSPESPWFNKRRLLFGLHKAKQALQRRIVVMEGYTDVIACHLAGFQGAVASLGTAFTAEHARAIERYATDGIVLMFDGDRAGLQAAERAHRELVNSRLQVRMAMMADAEDGAAKDPADVVTARPGEDPELLAERRARFADLLDGAEDSLAVWFRILRRRLDLSQAANVEAAARECTAILELVEAPVRRAALLQQMARHLAVPAPALERMAQKVRQQRVRSARNDGAAKPETAVPAAKPTPLQQSELELVACVLAAPDQLAGIDLDAEATIESGELSTLLAWAAEGVALGRTKSAELMRYLFARAAEQPALQAMLGRLHERAGKIHAPAVVLAGLMAGRRRLTGESQRRHLRQQLEQAIGRGDQVAAAAVQQQLLAHLREHLPRGPLGDNDARGAARPAAPAPDPS